MALSWTVPVLAVALLLFPGVQSAQAIAKCDLQGLCSCDTESGLISLEPLSGHKFKVSDLAKPEESYTYVPCVNFDEGGKTGGIIQKSYENYYTVGDNTKGQVTSKVSDTGNAEFTLKATDNQRDGIVDCVCDKGGSETLGFGGSSGASPIEYKFTFTSAYCCPGYSPPPSGTSGGLSVGSIIVIIFICVVLVYFIFGTIFQGVVRKHRGKEMLVNSSFWFAIPSLIKDGFIFTFTCGKRSTTYNSI